MICAYNEDRSIPPVLILLKVILATPLRRILMSFRMNHHLAYLDRKVKRDITVNDCSRGKTALR